MPEHALKLGLIGVGRIGRLHLDYLASSASAAEVVTIADVSEQAVHECADRYHIASYTCNYQEILADPTIQAIVICSPTDTHAQIIEEAALAGKHIFCEKPIAFDLPSIDRALAAVKQAGVKFQIGFNRRFDANFRRVRQAVEKAEIGQPHILHIFSYDPAPPSLEYIRRSGGLFVDMTIHDFDMAYFLIGSEIDEIFAAAGVLVSQAIGQAGDIDTALLTLRFRNGVLATISNSRQAVYGYDQRVEILGSQGSVLIENTYPNTAIISDSQGIRRDLPAHFLTERYSESFRMEMAAFIDAVSNDTPTAVGGVEGRAAISAALAAQKSLSERRPVRLDEVD